VDKEEIRKHVAAGRTCSDKNELGALELWTMWIREVKKAEHLGLDLAGELREERVWWAADYILFLFKVQQKRAEELKRAVANISAAFLTKMWDARMWDNKIVESTVKAGKRNIDELAAKMLKKAENESGSYGRMQDSRRGRKSRKGTFIRNKFSERTCLLDESVVHRRTEISC
jgi:hypothetical protein